MGLRLAEGIDVDRYASLSGRPPCPDKLARLGGHGFIATSGDGRRIAATQAGRRVLNAVIAELAAG
jgi:oxygen-independent coproporphyrinogen-3 oxidase